jgi:hypothetical protein
VPFLVNGIRSFATLLFSAFIGLGAVLLRKALAVVLGLVNFLASYIPCMGAVVGDAVAVLLATAIGEVLGGALASAMAAPFVAISLDAVRQIRAAGPVLSRPSQPFLPFGVGGRVMS